MRRAWCRSVIALVLVLMSTMFGGGVTVARDRAPAITPGSAVRTDGQTVVWQAKNGDQQFDTYRMAVGSTVGQILAGGTADQITPAVDRGRVVWVEGDTLTSKLDIRGIR